MFEKLKQHCDELIAQFDHIEPNRQAQLKKLSDYIAHKNKTANIPQLIAICTHNSRRSHITQLWFAVAADYYHQEIKSFSGGTEATSFFPSAIEALLNIGFEITQHNTSATNPIYNIRWKTDMPFYQAFSKQYSAPPNPTTNFGAIMVCDNANEACPIVYGSDFRLALPYQDPKKYDNTDIAEEKYLQCVKNIGREMLYAFSIV